MRSCPLLLLAACAAPPAPAGWPDGLPPRQAFLDRYEADPANRAAQSARDYLGFVILFYEGNALAPGWRAISRSLAGMDDGLSARLETVGAAIAAEWAKDNALRRIDTRHLRVWSAALRPAPTRAAVLDRILDDVARLLDGRLGRDEVTLARYREPSGAAPASVSPGSR
jgi:hypothetical protein